MIVRCWIKGNHIAVTTTFFKFLTTSTRARIISIWLTHYLHLIYTMLSLVWTILPLWTSTTSHSLSNFYHSSHLKKMLTHLANFKMLEVSLSLYRSLSTKCEHPFYLLLTPPLKRFLFMR